MIGKCEDLLSVGQDTLLRLGSGVSWRLKATKRPKAKKERIMLNKRQILQTIGITSAFIALSEPILACTIVPPSPPPIWIEDYGINPATGKQEFWVGFDLGQPGDPSVLFPATNATCECGLAIVPSMGGLPPESLMVTDARVAIKNLSTLTKRFDGVEDFDFDPVSGLEDELAMGSPDEKFQDPGNWFGLSTPPESVTVDQIILEPNEVIKLEYLIEIDPGEITGFNPSWTQIAARSPDTPGHMEFDYSGKVAINIPEPSSVLGLLAVTVLGAGVSRKKKNQKSKDTTKVS